MTTTNGFGQNQILYTVIIKWKHGFEHSYDQLLNDKQLVSEQERINALRWVDNVKFLISR